jgi:hypothetical protein
MVNGKVNALIHIDENTNRVLNVVKAKYDLKDKGEAVAFVVHKYIETEDEPELRPEFIQKMKKIKAQQNIVVKDFAQRYFP